MSSIRNGNVFIGVLNHTFSACMYKQKMTWIFLIDCCSKKKCQSPSFLFFHFFPSFVFILHRYCYSSISFPSPDQVLAAAPWFPTSLPLASAINHLAGLLLIWIQRGWLQIEFEGGIENSQNQTPAYISSNPVSSLPLSVSPSPPIFLFPDPYNQANNPVNLSHSAQNPKGF